jgi:hypothetical protein
VTRNPKDIPTPTPNNNTPIENTLNQSRARMISELFKASGTQKKQREKFEASKTNPTQTTDSIYPHTPPHGPNPSSITDEASEWSVVGSAKRKAKDSPTKTSAKTTIRKDLPKRSAKKPLLIYAHDSTEEGVVGQKN